MSKASTLKISRSSLGQVENFRQDLYHEAGNLFSSFIPQKIVKLDNLLKDEALNIKDMSSLHAPLDIPIPDPPAPEDEVRLLDLQFLHIKLKILVLLDMIKPEIADFRETLITISCWIQHLIPKIEDGNDFGVAIQEKVLERMAAVRTKAETFQTNINKYYLERGDAVAKASKEGHVMDYRSLVHEKDENIYAEIRVIALDIRGFYAEFYDITSKNLEKITNPKGEEKPSMY
uniref:Proteasome activator complex subunit 2 n=1 Tax=Amphiprion ocellaris TaxID=80972 RepID=A0A3Q1BUX6_AMPOC